MLPIKSILWPSDASKSANRALEVAIQLAVQFGAKLYGLQVVTEVPTFAETGPPLSGIDIPRYELELKQAARKALEQTIAEKVPKNIAIETSIEIGKPADVILNYAKERRIELIVMSTHGRTGLSHLMIGSVAENIIRRSPIPTLIIPSVKE
jgi:nucleotide-binding universal stress UspA family protein